MAKTETADRLTLTATFVRIAEAGSLSAAARQLNTTQATVSRRLKSLETLLGVVLFIRNTHALKITDEGAALYEQAKTLIRDWDTLTETMQTAREKPAGLLRVRVPHAFGQGQMLTIICRFLAQYPDVDIVWSLNDDVPDFLKDQVDCAIYVGRHPDPNHIALQVAEVPRIIIASPAVTAAGEPADSAALAHYPWVSLSTFYTYHISLKTCAAGVVTKTDIRPRLLTDNLFSLKEAVIQGTGLGVISAWMVTEDIRQGRLVHVLPELEGEPLPVYILYPYASAYPVRLRKFITMMKQELPLIEGVRPITQASF